jgi:phosphohistidine phosphatase SixA
VAAGKNIAPAFKVLKPFGILKGFAMTIRKSWIAIIMGIGLLVCAIGRASPDRLIAQIKSGGHVIMIRHAHAPGIGDPDHFRIGDCATQRNLNDQGRKQARQIGHWLRRQGIDTARIFSSQWCRCLETARGLELGPVTELPALNSFFDRPQDREPNLTALQAFLSQQPTDGKLIVLVTHSVTISSITGKGVSSGQGVVLKLQNDGGAKYIGPLTFDF